MQTISISVSTIKKGKVYGILPCDPKVDAYMSRKQFIDSVKIWAAGYFNNLHSIFVAVEEDLYSLMIVLDINNDHEDFQKVVEIPVVERI